MKILFLNTWNGKIKDGIESFLREQSGDTDVFCLQEVLYDMHIVCKKIFPNHKEYASDKNIDKNLENKYAEFFKATYVNKDLEVLSYQVVLDSRLGLYTQVKSGNSIIHICNFHGPAKPGDKLDNPDRLEQCRGLIDFFKDKKGPKIIGGDFNILPDTKSVRMFAENGYRNLVKDFNVSTTRNRLAWEKYPDSKQYYSDYVFVSPDIKVNDFSVPNIEISDHLPLILDIEL